MTSSRQKLLSEIEILKGMNEISNLAVDLPMIEFTLNNIEYMLDVSEYPQNITIFQNDSDPIIVNNNLKSLVSKLNTNDINKHVKLMKNIDNDSINLETDDIIESCIVKIKINILEIISFTSAKAWCVDPNLPIIIELTFPQDANFDYSYHFPKLEIYQKQENKNFGLKFQLENILTNFLKNIYSSDIVWFPDLSKIKEFDKGIIFTEYGLFFMIKTYIMSRINDLQKFCVLCDNPHIFNTDMINRTVCIRPLCCFSYQQLGVAKDIINVLSSSIDVIDLLIKFTKSTIKSSRRDIIFDPFPTITDDEDPNKLILDPNNPDYEKCSNILSNLPNNIKDIINQDMNDFSEIQNFLSTDCYNVLKWIISSNRSHIVKLNPGEYIKTLNTTEQYLMLSQPPEKEQKFKELKEQYGSTFVFHGSPFINWHAIVRKGLKNASGTKLQINGAAYGNGIYLSTSFQLSFGYSKGNRYSTVNNSSTNNDDNDDNYVCIAICEVIDHEIKKSGSIWVIADEDKVCTRFLLVYPKNQNYFECNTTNISDDIKRSMSFYGLD